MPLSAFIFMVAVMSRRAYGQTCTWTWHEPSDEMLIRSVGAPATFTASVNDVLSNSDFLTWKSGTTDLVIQEYNAGAFTTTVNTRSFTASFAALDPGPGNNYTLNFPTAGGVLASDDSGLITVTSQGCTTGGTSPSRFLSVSYCALDVFEPNAFTTDRTAGNCGYQCEREFMCTACGLKIRAMCTVDARWDTSVSSQCQLECDKKSTAFIFMIMCIVLSLVDIALAFFVCSPTTLIISAVLGLLLLGLVITLYAVPVLTASLITGVIWATLLIVLLIVMGYYIIKDFQKNNTGPQPAENNTGPQPAENETGSQPKSDDIA